MALIGLGSRPQVLVLRALGLGDLLTGLPALRALRNGMDDPVVTLAAPAALAPLVRLCGAVDELLPTAGLAAVHRLDPVPDLGVNLHGCGPQSSRALLRSGSRQILTHHHRDVPQLDGPSWDPDLHEVDRWCRLVESAGYAADRAALGLTVPTIVPSVRDAVVIHPGAASPARRWPVHRFAALAVELLRQGHRVVITGIASELPLAQEVAETAGLPGTAMLAGSLDLEQLAALVAAARLVICGDTGIAHLASAYEVPSVLLFGPTPPSRWGPPEAGPHTVLWAGRHGDPHGPTVDPGLVQITVPEVLRAVENRLAATSVTP